MNLRLFSYFDAFLAKEYTKFKNLSVLYLLENLQSLAVAFAITTI